MCYEHSIMGPYGGENYLWLHSSCVWLLDDRELKMVQVVYEAYV